MPGRIAVRFQCNRGKGPALFVQPWKELAMRTVSITCFVFMSSVVAGANAEVLDEPTDLDLTGVVKAINFGKTTDQMIGGVTFLAAPENATTSGVTNRATGAVAVGQYDQTLPELGSDRDDDALEQLLGTSIFGSDAGSTNIELDVPVPNGFYRAQLILYDGWQSVTGNRRDVDHYVEGTLAAAHVQDHGSLYSHMVDQFYGMTAQPGGGLYVLSDAFGPQPQVRDVLADSVVQQGRIAGEKLLGGSSKKWNISFYDRTASLHGEETEGGAFLSPDLSFVPRNP